MSKAKNLEELNELAEKYGFSSAHNAITCANIYRKAYSEHLHKYNVVKNVIVSIKNVLSQDMGEIIDEKLEEEMHKGSLCKICSTPHECEDTCLHPFNGLEL